MKVIVHIEIDDAQRRVMARALDTTGLATRAQVNSVTKSLLSNWLLIRAGQQSIADEESWRRGQPRVTR